MNELVSINGRAVERITYREHPVITLPMIDDLHDRPKSTARKAFNRHKKRMTEGKHYFIVPKEDWSNVLGVHDMDDQTAKTRGGHTGDMMFLTQIGYVMLVKVFNDDLAWDIYAIMVDNYFIQKALSIQSQQQLPSPVNTKVNVNTSDLVREANKGNRFAQRLLHHLTGMQVDDIADEIEHKLVAEDFRRAELAAKYFDLLFKSQDKMGIIEGTGDEGAPYLQGTTTQFFNAFKVLGRANRLPMLAKEAHTLGTFLSKEATGLEFCGWRRSVGRVLRGVRYFRYEKVEGVMQ